MVVKPTIPHHCGTCTRVFSFFYHLLNPKLSVWIITSAPSWWRHPIRRISFDSSLYLMLYWRRAILCAPCSSCHPHQSRVAQLPPTRPLSDPSTAMSCTYQARVPIVLTLPRPNVYGFSVLVSMGKYSLLFSITMSYWLHLTRSFHRLISHLSFHFAPSAEDGLWREEGCEKPLSVAFAPFLLNQCWIQETMFSSEGRRSWVVWLFGIV